MRNQIKFAVIALLLFLATSCRWVSSTETISLQSKVNNALFNKTSDEVLTTLGQPSSVALDTIESIGITKFRYEDAVTLHSFADYNKKYQKESPWMDVYLKNGRAYSVKTNMVTTLISKNEYTISIIKLGTYAGILLFIVAITAIAVILTRKNDIEELKLTISHLQIKFQKEIIELKNVANLHKSDLRGDIKMIKLRIDNLRDTIKELEQQKSEALSIEDTRKLLNKPIEYAPLSFKVKNTLKVAGIETVRDLVLTDPKTYRKYRGFGKKSLWECEDFLVKNNLHFGMDLSPYDVPEEKAPEKETEEPVIE